MRRGLGWHGSLCPEQRGTSQMGMSLGANFNNQPPSAMLPPRQLHPRSPGLRTSLSFAPGMPFAVAQSQQYSPVQGLQLLSTGFPIEQLYYNSNCTVI